ncbi:MAG: formylmethanofuran--tetrahydromethanopterin N-formyltransferase [Planctomycetota bacterium]
MTGDFHLDGVPIRDTFAEAFDMKATRLIVTAADQRWCHDAAMAMVGFGTSVIACGVEIAIERVLHESETPDQRPGIAILAFAVSGRELEKQIPRRAGQCILTCPTASIYGGMMRDGINAGRSSIPKRIPLGKSLRFFGDGYQISKSITLVDEAGRDQVRRYWRIPVMDGEFVCEHDVGRVDAIGGGNFILFGRCLSSVTIACRAAVDAMSPLPGIITPFPGGATRSGSKVGSKYPSVFASTNDRFCPSLRGQTDSLLPDDAAVAIEIVLDGLTADEIRSAMNAGIRAACKAKSDSGRKLIGITAGNYGGQLGRHHFHLRDVLKDGP